MRYLLNKVLLFIVSFCLVLITPVIAQQTINLPNFSLYEAPIVSPFRLTENNAPVILDGREIFQVGGFRDRNNYVSATKRAAKIAEQLEEAVRASNPPQLEIKNNNGLPTIYLNDNYLFTVTLKDTANDNSRTETAIELEQKIANSIIQGQQERKQNYQSRQYIIAAIIIAIALIINRFLNLSKIHSYPKAWRFLLSFKRATSQTDTQSLNLLSKTKLYSARVLLWSGTVYWITDLFPLTRRLRYEIINSVWNALNYPLFSLANQDYSIVSILILIGLFWGLFSFIGTLTNLLKNNVLHRTGMSRGSQEVIFIITKYALFAIGTIILLQIWGLNLSSLTILGSALGVGIGFGFQDIAKNFASGLVLLFERSVQVGDFIEVNGQKGTVERVGARSIVLRTLDRVSIIVPNSSLLAEEVVNWTHEGSISRLHLSVGVAYGSDTEAVKEVLLDAAASHVEVLRNPAPQVLFVNFGDSSLDFQLLIWVSEPSHQAFIQSDLFFHIEKLLREREIEIPFPQRDIQLRNPNLSIGLSNDVETALKKWLSQLNGKS